MYFCSVVSVHLKGKEKEEGHIKYNSIRHSHFEKLIVAQLVKTLSPGRTLAPFLWVCRLTFCIRCHLLMRATCSAYLIILILFGEECKLSLCYFLHVSVTSSCLGPSVLNFLVSNNLKRCSSLMVRNQVSHPHKATYNIMLSYILIINSAMV
jgi:hypothetical protein